jgi:hypothetical protein
MRRLLSAADDDAGVSNSVLRRLIVICLPVRAYNMFHSRRFRACIRPWLAVTVSYAVALQMLLTGIVTSQIAAQPDSASGNPFVICFGSRNGAPGDTNKSGKTFLGDLTCLRCALATNSLATLPATADSYFAFATGVCYATFLTTAAVFSNRHNPRQSQGPPLTA